MKLLAPPIAIAAALALFGAAGAVAAPPAIKAPAQKNVQLSPGLWEMVTRMQGQDPATQQAMAVAQARIAQMPPEQRRQIEQTLAGRGVDVRLGAEALTARICITREMTERVAIASQRIGNCRTERSARTGNTIQFAALCSEPRTTTEGKTTIIDAKNFESRSTTTAETAGTTRMTTMEQTGRWISADCGPVQSAPQ